MPSIMGIEISNRELKYYREWVEGTQEKDIQEYLANQITHKLKTLRKQDGRCNQRSIQLEKGGYKGSCNWSSQDNSYKVIMRKNKRSITYGFFSNLYSAELELQRLFEEDIEDLWEVAKERQKYYQVQHRLKTRPKLTDNTFQILRIENKKHGLVFHFRNRFVNPITGKQQKMVSWSNGWFKIFDKKQILKECIKLDDPVEIVKYRGDLKQQLNEHKRQDKDTT